MRAVYMKSVFRFSTKQPKNYYKLFNLSPGFTDEQLKSSYLQLVKKYHPDLSKDPNSAQIFRDIQQGYIILSNTSSRLNHQKQQKQSNSQEIMSQTQKIVEQMRKNFYFDYKRKDPVNDEFNFSYKMFKQHYEKVQMPKAEYRKYEGHDKEYYARKDEKGESLMKQLMVGGASVAVIALAYFYTNS